MRKKYKLKELEEIDAMSNDQKHTQGKWYISADYKGDDIIPIESQNDNIVTMVADVIVDSCDITDESEANARLISKAPEMLRLLEEFTDKQHVKDCGFYNNNYGQNCHCIYGRSNKLLAQIKGE